MKTMPFEPELRAKVKAAEQGPPREHRKRKRKPDEFRLPDAPYVVQEFDGIVVWIIDDYRVGMVNRFKVVSDDRVIAKVGVEMIPRYFTAKVDLFWTEAEALAACRAAIDETRLLLDRREPLIAQRLAEL